MTTIMSQIYSLVQMIELALQKNFSGPQLKTDDFVTKMDEQTNFYAVQRGLPLSFKPVSGGHESYLYIYIHTDSGRRSGGVAKTSVNSVMGS